MKSVAINIFEDDHVFDFGPLIPSRPVWNLRLGAFTFYERLLRQFSATRINTFQRHEIKPLTEVETRENLTLMPENNHTTDLYINGRMMLTANDAARLMHETDAVVYQYGNEILAFRLNREGKDRQLWDERGLLNVHGLDNMERRGLEGRLFHYHYEMVQHNAEAIYRDFELQSGKYPANVLKAPSDAAVREPKNIEAVGLATIGPGAILNAEKHRIRLGKNAVIGPGVILDAAEGPVWIDQSAEVKAGAVLLGPVYVGPNAIIRPGARLYGGVTLGPHCRVGGEVADSIMVGYSSKQHSGYLGASYVGEWVNLGADTNNSDLKNNYKPVEVILNGRRIDSGDLHVGVLIADFSRTAIQTRLNSGTVIGVSCNILGNDFPEKYVPSFSWVSSEGAQEYKLDKALETIAAVMPRRGRELTPALREALTRHFKETAPERAAFI